MGFSFFAAGKLPSRGEIFGGGFGRYWGGQNWNRIFEKTKVAVGRTELSLRLSCTEFCALSSGHGPRGLGFQGGEEGVDFHVFRGGQKSAKMLICMTFLGETKMEKNMKMQDEHG